MATTLTQVTYRFRNDDGTETGASWLAAENTAPELHIGQTYRVRFLIQESGGTALSGGSLNLYGAWDGTNYLAVSKALAPRAITGSRYYSHGDDTTEQLTGGTGSFTANNNGMANDICTATATIGANEYAEVEYIFKLRYDGLTEGMTIYLKVYNSTSAISAYTNIASFTVRGGGGRGRRR